MCVKLCYKVYILQICFEHEINKLNISVYIYSIYVCLFTVVQDSGRIMVTPLQSPEVDGVAGLAVTMRPDRLHLNPPPPKKSEKRRWSSLSDSGTSHSSYVSGNTEAKMEPHTDIPLQLDTKH